jgi:catechol 2,3-dioxygenase-like lactoylglutathione lyase family enzyme
MGSMKITNVLAALPVRDLDAAVRWFGELVGAGPTARPMDGLAEWRFPAGGWVQVFADAERAGKGSLTVIVDDIEACRRDLAAKGIAIDSSGDGGTTRISTITDPDGNRIVLAQSEDREKNPSASGVVP